MHPHILQHLGIYREALTELCQALLLAQHRLHHFDGGQDAVTRSGVPQKNDMTGLLAAEGIVMCRHVLIDEAVTHLRLLVADTCRLQGLVQAEVGHHRGDNGVILELASLLHVAAADIHDLIAVHQLSLVVHRKAAVRITVIGKAQITALLQHVLLQCFNVGAAAVQVDVQAIGFIVDDMGICTQRIEYGLCTRAGGAIGAVQRHLHALEGLGGQGNEVTDIAVPACREVHGATDMIPAGQRHLRGSAIQVILDLRDHVIGELLAVLIDDLEAVVIVGIVGSGNHNTTVKIL